MKRDMNLIRLILLRTEDENPKFSLDDYTEDQIKYHAALLIRAGYLTGKMVGDGPIPAAIQWDGLTWQGHEFLDDIRNDTVWNQTKEKVGTHLQTISVAMLQETAKSVVRAMMGLP